VVGGRLGGIGGNRVCRGSAISGGGRGAGRELPPTHRGKGTPGRRGRANERGQRGDRY
jgi:hypothetical protein